MKVGNQKLRANPKQRMANIGKLVARATTPVQGPMAKNTYGLAKLSTGPKAPRIK